MNAVVTKTIVTLCLVLGAECLCIGDDDAEPIKRNCSDVRTYISPYCLNITVNAYNLDPFAVVTAFCTECREEILIFICDCDELNCTTIYDFIHNCAVFGYPPPRRYPTSPPPTVTTQPVSPSTTRCVASPPIATHSTSPATKSKVASPSMNYPPLQPMYPTLTHSTSPAPSMKHHISPSTTYLTSPETKYTISPSATYSTLLPKTTQLHRQ